MNSTELENKKSKRKEQIERLINENNNLISSIYSVINQHGEILNKEIIKELTKRISFKESEYAKYDISELEDIKDYFKMFLFMPQSYDFDIKQKNSKDYSTIYYFDSDLYVMGGIIIHLDQLKKFLNYSLKDYDIDEERLSKDFEFFVKAMTEENKKAMHQDLKNFLLEDYNIQNLTTGVPSYEDVVKEGKYSLRLTFTDENTEPENYRNPVINHYFHLKGKSIEEQDDKKTFNPVINDKNMIVMHYSKKHHTTKQLELLRNFYNIMILPIVKLRFENNELAQKINVIGFLKSIINAMTDEQNLVDAEYYQEKIYSIFREFFNKIEKQMKEENSSYLDNLKKQNKILNTELKDLNMLVYSKKYGDVSTITAGALRKFIMS